MTIRPFICHLVKVQQEMSKVGALNHTSQHKYV